MINNKDTLDINKHGVWDCPISESFIKRKFKLKHILPLWNISFQGRGWQGTLVQRVWVHLGVHVFYIWKSTLVFTQGKSNFIAQVVEWLSLTGQLCESNTPSKTNLVIFVQNIIKVVNLRSTTMAQPIFNCAHCAKSFKNWGDFLSHKKTTYTNHSGAELRHCGLIWSNCLWMRVHKSKPITLCGL